MAGPERSQTLSDIDVFGTSLSLIAKGDPGTGKTIGTTSFTRAGDMFVFDIDQRISSAKLMYGDLKSLSFIQPSNYKQIADKLDSLITHNPYRTIEVASLTSLSRMLMSLSRRDRYQFDNSAQNMAKRWDRLKAAGIATSEIEDYSIEANGINDVIDALRVLFKKGKGCNIILSAHVLEVQSDKLDGTSTIKRYLVNAGAKRIVAEVPSYFNESWHFDTETKTVDGQLKTHYYILTQGIAEDWAKTALPIQPKIDFTNKRLYDLVADQVKKARETWKPPLAEAETV